MDGKKMSFTEEVLLAVQEAELEKVRKELRMTRRQLMLCKSGAENEVGNGSVVEDKDALRGGGGSEPEEGGDVEGEEESVSAQLLEARKQVFDMEEELKVAQEHLRLDEQIFEEKTTELAKLKVLFSAQSNHVCVPCVGHFCCLTSPLCATEQAPKQCGEIRGSKF